MPADSLFPYTFLNFYLSIVLLGGKARCTEMKLVARVRVVDHVRLIHEVSTDYRELRERVPKLPLLCIIRLSRQLIQRVKSADWNIRLQFRIGYTAGILKSRLTDPSCRRSLNQKGRLHHAHLIRIMHD